MTASAPLLLYDGTCGFCAASLAFMLRHERQHTLRFATLQGSLGSEILRRHPELQGVDSMVWVDSAPGGHEEVFVRSAAALRAARYLGGAWSLLRVGNLLPARLLDRIYDWIARHRHSLSASGTRCFVPTVEQASRFLNAPESAVLRRASLEDSGEHHSP
jgi:predicted DCC family thiol-disulfide oxidoreductase YuxK